MAEQGHILLATDCHRTSQWWPKSLAAWRVEPLDPIELVDAARGQDACIAFYRMWVDYFIDLKEETLLAHSRIGEATVLEIVEDLGIPIIDTQGAFLAHDDPLSLFPFRRHGHYTEEGYRLATESIISSLPAPVRSE